jgi:hypothetical protein
MADIAHTLGGDPVLAGPVALAISTAMIASSATALLLKRMGYLSLLVGVLLIPIALFGWRPRA